MPEKSRLAQFQDALMELLTSRLSHEQITERLKTNPEFAFYREYVEEFDADMVAIACELMGKWARPVSGLRDDAD